MDPWRETNRRASQAPPIHAVVVRQWPGRDDGPGGTTLFLTEASVETPVPPFDDDAERCLIGTYGIKDAKPHWDLGHPPQNTERAVRGHVLCTRLMLALATAYRLQCEREAIGGEPAAGHAGGASSASRPATR